MRRLCDHRRSQKTRLLAGDFNNIFALGLAESRAPAVGNVVPDGPSRDPCGPRRFGRLKPPFRPCLPYYRRTDGIGKIKHVISGGMPADVPYPLRFLGA